MSTQLIKPNYLVILPPTQHHSFFRNFPHFFNCTIVYFALRNSASKRSILEIFRFHMPRISGFRIFGKIELQFKRTISWEKWAKLHEISLHYFCRSKRSKNVHCKMEQLCLFSRLVYYNTRVSEGCLICFRSRLLMLWNLVNSLLVYAVNSTNCFLVCRQFHILSLHHYIKTI